MFHSSHICFGGKLFLLFRLFLVTSLLVLSACQAPTTVTGITLPTTTPRANEADLLEAAAVVERPQYEPGELVDYTVQTGDSLSALASHFHTTVDEILVANPSIPKDVTTLPPGMPMQIPIYYQPLWGSSYQIFPDSLFVNGPAQSDFDVVEFVNSQPGWLKEYEDFAESETLRGGEVIQYVAKNYSISPRLLLAILEYQTGALSEKHMPEDTDFILGFEDLVHKRISQQLGVASNMLNSAYYGWRTGSLKSFEHLDGRLEIPDPWQNSATVALQVYFAHFFDGDEYKQVTQADGWVQTYIKLFGDPWSADNPHIPGSLVQPSLHLPFSTGKSWTLTGGPHTGWGDGLPWSALDFAPLGVKGCNFSDEWVVAVASGIIIRTGKGVAVLDLDGDGDEHTGWVIFYLHLDDVDKIQVGAHVETGDAIGHPSCLGGNATGTHIHIARKYNGEWISASGVLAFNMENWIAQDGDKAYGGKLIRFNREVIASEVSDSSSLIMSEIQ